MSENFEHATMTALQAHAMAMPGVTEGASCVNRAFKAGKKNFLFLGETEKGCRIMLKLDASRSDAEVLAKTPGLDLGIGKTAWLTLRFDEEPGVEFETLQSWVDESYRLFATKKLLAELDS